MCECMCACGDMICSRQLLSDWVWTTSGITPALLLNMLTTGCTYTSSQQTAFHAFPGIKVTCLTEKVIETKRECKWQTKHVEPKSESIDKIKQPNVCILHRHNEAMIIIIKITEIVEETKKKKKTRITTLIRTERQKYFRDDSFGMEIGVWKIWALILKSAYINHTRCSL